VSNACRHARARTIAVRLRRGAGALELMVEDDGVGIDPLAAPGRGLASMRARAAELGAQVDILPLSPGTRVRVVLPARTREPVDGAA